VNAQRLRELVNLPIERLVEQLVKGELDLDDELVLSLWIRLLLELEDIKNILVSMA
jgi:hypothetical protein